MSPVRTLATAQLRADLRHARSGKRATGRLATTVIAYGFSGLVLALSLGDAPAASAMFVGGSFAIVLAAFGVVGSYDELMSRPRDNAWLATLPATERQHYAARLAGVGVYVALMAVGIATPVTVGTGLSHGPMLGLLVGLGIVGATAWTALLILAVLWGLTLSLPVTALRMALSVARTALIAALVLGFQLVGASDEALAAPWWPGAWLADALDGRPTWGLAVLVGSLVAFAVVFTAVFPTRYFRVLRRLADGLRTQGKRSRIGRQMTAPERWAVRRGAVRAAYGFATAAFADDRLVRGRLWPAALLPAGFVAFGWFNDGLHSLVGVGQYGIAAGALAVLQDPGTQFHLSVLVVLLFCVQTLVQTLQMSDHAEASWVFGTLPDARPRVVQVGAQKALAWRVLFPLHVGIAVLLTLMMPAADGVVHAAFWFAVAVFGARVTSLTYGTPPFSRPGDKFDAASRFIPLFVSIPAAIGLLVFQIWAFATVGRAVGVTVATLVASALLGEVVIRWPRRRPAWRPVALHTTAAPASEARAA
ncbi:hypothetical protein [Rubrivirga marina]|uniref:Uncharacterized protein n=1 Tax=Rubrivirga marina TaxID=1196024 RepID=A0A271IVU2_9BACT|nr:hypothetical protein [Rubrivirga marina]PAP75230.1 hypothetical protein BSZ37_01625 [Rubrivirga marina]